MDHLHFVVVVYHVTMLTCETYGDRLCYIHYTELYNIKNFKDQFLKIPCKSPLLSNLPPLPSLSNDP